MDATPIEKAPTSKLSAGRGFFCFLAKEIECPNEEIRLLFAFQIFILG